MPKIKIISNPYRKETVFQSWDESVSDWRTIDHESNSNSGLLSDGLCIGFFPFKAKQIIDIIVAEYGIDSEKVDIEFQGTDDEYRELESICIDGRYTESVNLYKSEMYLENARDILPDVIDVFKKLSPLVAESVSDKAKIKRELEKFSDASNDVIPVCVIGNYSSGKSTFINALIGYELLPSSDEPTTAKIYKISRSKYSDRAKIDFEYDGQNVAVQFTTATFRFISDPNENPVSVMLRQALSEITGVSIPAKLSRSLELINSFANKNKDEKISDLIEIEAPFDEDGLWGKIRNNFVIFDTPGSNSASNVKHYQVLNKAMEDLSNGLPIFISEYDSLDSTDNDKLYQDINNMKELDNRFTMIIVNKADAASLKKTGHTDDDCDRILSLTIPRKLYSGGLYFVSSIIGLGSKNDQDFLSDHNAEVFEDQRSKYTNPSSRFYKQLYRYNILPEQIKQKYDALSEKHANLLYANSGLYCIEQAIEDFAGFYSPYNKCQQSQLFLGKVIQITSDEVAIAKQLREKHREYTYAQLEEGKRTLVDRVEQQSGQFEMQFRQDYPPFMGEFVASANSAFTYETLKIKEESFRRAEQTEKDVKGRERDLSESWKSLWGGVHGNFSKAFSERELGHILKIGTTVTESIRDIAEKTNERTNAMVEAEKAAADEMITFIREAFTVNINEAQTLLETHSRKYWANKAEVIRRDLSQIVTDSSELTDDKRSELAEIIIEYQQLAFENKAEVIFDKEIFRRRLLGDTNRLDIERLARRYNSEIQRQVEEIAATFESSHAKSFNIWLNNLIAIIEENIVEFSPKLHIQAKLIQDDNATIAELEFKMAKLNDYTAQVRRMMDWKVANCYSDNKN